MGFLSPPGRKEEEEVGCGGVIRNTSHDPPKVCVSQEGERKKKEGRMGQKSSKWTLTQLQEEEEEEEKKTLFHPFLLWFEEREREREKERKREKLTSY